MSQPSTFFLTLVRHGQTAANRARIIQGQSDVPLSEAGRVQAERLHSHFESIGLNFDLVYSSDLSRAYDTCRTVVGPGKEIIIESRLRERAFGIIEGKTCEFFRAEAARAGHNDSNYSSFTPEGAETLPHVNERIRDFCDNHLAKVVRPGFHVLVVTHGGVIREFMRYFKDRLECDFSGLEPLKVTPNTGVNLFRICYSFKGLLLSDCLKIHEDSHLREENRLVFDSNETKAVNERVGEVPLEAL